MWWIPLATAAGLALVIAAVHLWHQKRQVSAAKTYRARYVQLVSQLDTVTRSVNKMGRNAESIKEAKLLDYYESTLRVLETLLTAIRRIPPFGNDPSALDSAFFLVRDCRTRIGRLEHGFRDALKGKEVKYDDLYGLESGPQATGCYFCSRPLVISRFSKVKVRIEGEVKEVISCKVCRGELETTKKVKVLYFIKDGRPVHWSKVPDYQPSEDYWDINKRDPVRKTPQLELVYSSTQKSLGGRSDKSPE